MSRLIESSLTGKISRMLMESENLTEATDKEAEKMLSIKSKKLDESKEFIDSLDAIADFMIDFDKYGFEDSYDGDYDAKRDALIRDIVSDRKTVAAYLNDVVVEQLGTEEQQKEAKRLLGSADLEKYLKESVEEESRADKLNKELNKYIKSSVSQDGTLKFLKGTLTLNDDGTSTYKSDWLEEDKGELTFDSDNRVVGVIKGLVSVFDLKESETPDLERVMDGTMDDYSYSTIKAKDAADKKKEIEDRIGELKLAIADGVSEDEKEAMEKEIAELESHLDESSKLNEDSYEEPFFAEIEDALVNAGFDVRRYTDAGMTTNNLGWVISNSEGEVQLTCAGTYLSEGTLKESVSVATSDGSTVDTQDAASVQSNDGSVTVVTGDTTVVINNSPVEPALDTPQEEPVEEVPEEPVSDDVAVEEPLDEAKLMTPDEALDSQGTTNQDIINAGREPEERVEIIDTKDVSVIKNQGNVYMLSFKDAEGTEFYMVCENFNQDTYEADEAERYNNKEEADKDYFERVGLEVQEA